MADCARCRTSKRLYQGSLCTGHLVAPGLAPQLDHRFDRLVHTGRASGETARLHASHGCARNPPAWSDLAVRGKGPAFPLDGKAHGFELQRCVNTEDVMVFEHINIIQYYASLLHRFARRDLRGVKVQDVFAVMQCQRIGRRGGSCDFDQGE